MTDLQTIISILTKMDKTDFHCHFDNEEEIWEVTIDHERFPGMKYRDTLTNLIFNKKGKLKIVYPVDREETY